ncbi:MAG: hypothetical protein C0467_29205 [Planctomycetaceae bacterium]|nr:hypothetical protein [Planctomycetaceae bacterium]
MPRPKSGNRKVAKKKETFIEPTQTVSTVPVSLSLAMKLRDLDQALFAEFGFSVHESFAYTVSGGGGVLAASSDSAVVVPAVKADPSEGRVYSPEEMWMQPTGTKVVHPTLGVGEVKAAGRVPNDELDDRVVTFAGGETFVLPAPASGANAPPWDRVVKVIRPNSAVINTAYTPA